MTDEQIDDLWIYRPDIHDGELMPQLRDFARALLASQPAAIDKEAAWIRMDHLRQAQQAPFLCRVEPSYRPGLDLVPIFLAAPLDKEASQTALTDELRECMYLFSAIGGMSRNNLENLAFERIEAIRKLLGDQEAPSLIKE